MKKAEQILTQYIQSMSNPEKALSYVHEDAKFIAAKEHPSTKHHFYGTYRGPEGVRNLLSKFQKDLDTQEFTIHKIIGDELTAFAWGKFIHRIRTTNKLFESYWAVVVEVEDDKIKFFQGFEDTAGLEESFKKE
ncbi:Ketosteroid isomerase-related protein [Seinonella peptonophila]|uniref:Ketosteroid isomerase-related protein n=1 Tax=Seinonella peptonophila TaxID=112248 RepID=A0A1M5B702_9BACL|nr:nuclear transport factor 2 family protein [Seinonella peptonophila]SHF38293.1 Ketosteroid isomerase-related protein [Seinonella peptonophila]